MVKKIKHKEQAGRGTLALVGGGEFSPYCSFDTELVAKSAETKNISVADAHVLILPTAAAYENPAKKVQQGIDYFCNLDINASALEVYTRTDALNINLGELKEKLEIASVIYITSGSPMHLHSVLLNTPFWEEIKAAWQAGATLVGSGSGGDVLCDYMVDDRGGAFTVGLKVICEISMIPAYDLWSEDKVHRTVELAPANIFVTGIPLQTTLISVAGEPWKEMGLGTVDVFKEGQKLAVKDLPVL